MFQIENHHESLLLRRYEATSSTHRYTAPTEITTPGFVKGKKSQQGIAQETRREASYDNIKNGQLGLSSTQWVLDRSDTRSRCPQTKADTVLQSNIRAWYGEDQRGWETEEGNKGKENQDRSFNGFREQLGMRTHSQEKTIDTNTRTDTGTVLGSGAMEIRPRKDIGDPVSFEVVR